MIKQIIKRIWEYSPKNNWESALEKINAPFVQNNFHNLRKIPRFTETQIKLFGKDLKVADAPSFFSSYKTIMCSEIYKFETDSKQPLIIDCGANIGLSVIYFKRLFPGAKVIAFEPDKKIFNILQCNMKSFGYDNVELINKALWNRESEVDFYSEGADAGHVVNTTNHEQITTVSAVRLRPYLTCKVDFLKIDIEGAEYEVLNDNKDLLCSVHNLFVEYHSFVGQEQKLSEMLKILKDGGFRYYIYNNSKQTHHPFIEKEVYSGMDMQLNIYACRF